MEVFVFTVIILKEDHAYSELCPELDVASQGKTSAEARKNLLEIATLHLEGSLKDGLPYLRPVPSEEYPRNSIPAGSLKVFKFKVDAP